MRLGLVISSIFWLCTSNPIDKCMKDESIDVPISIVLRDQNKEYYIIHTSNDEPALIEKFKSIGLNPLNPLDTYPKCGWMLLESIRSNDKCFDIKVLTDISEKPIYNKNTIETIKGIIKESNTPIKSTESTESTELSTHLPSILVLITLIGISVCMIAFFYETKFKHMHSMNDIIRKMV